MKLKELHEQYNKLLKETWVIADELEELIREDNFDFDARVYININDVLIKTNIKLTPRLISKIMSKYYLELTNIKTVIKDNMVSTTTLYEYTFKYQ